MTSRRAIWRRLANVGVVIVGVAVMYEAPRFVEPYTIVSLITILMYVTLTLSWVIFSGPTTYISLATAAFFGVGMYATAVVGQNYSLPVAILIGGGVSFVLALFIGLLTLRLKGIYFILFTFGASALFRHALLWWETHVTLTVGRFVLGQGFETVYNALLVIFVITLLTAYLIRETRIGTALRSVGENEEAAAHIGINVVMLKTLTFAVSALFMGATGAIMATRWTYIDPRIAFNPLISFLPVLMAIFGGMARLSGPILGAAVFAVLQEYLITSNANLYMLLMGATLIVVILYLPDGLLGLVDRGMRRLNWPARINRIVAVLKGV